MPVTGVQVFGPIAIDPGFNITGEKTLLTMDTTLPSGGRNIILVSYAGYTDLSALGNFRIYKGSTLLYETLTSGATVIGEMFTHTRTRPFHHLLIAVDDSPAGNDSYSFRINIETAATSSASVHVQGMVIKADTAAWGYNDTVVIIRSGETGTVTSINTSFPSGSKVAVIATVYAVTPSLVQGNYLVGAGNIKLKSGSTVVSSNQFNIGSFVERYPFRMSLIYLDIPTSDSQTYSVEITNGSSSIHRCWAEIVAFTVADAAFLDTGSVTVATSQTTVGNLSTTLSGDVAVIALAAAERTTNNDGDTFLANAVVLQRDNSSAGQVSNLLRWYIFRNSYNARSGVLPLFRYDTDVSNPSYQVKMTANTGSPNGEAKILAFSVAVSGIDIKKVIVENMNAVEGFIFHRGRFRQLLEFMNLGETSIRLRGLVRPVVEVVNLVESSVIRRAWVRIVDEVERVVELLNFLRIRVRQIVESTNIFETTARMRGLVSTISENVRISELVSRLQGYIIQVGERINIYELPSRLRSIFRHAVNYVLVNEVIGLSKSLVRLIVEAERILESLLKFRVVSRVVNEFMRVTESLTLAVSKGIVILEGVVIPELAGRVRGLMKTIAEQVIVSELISKSIRFVRISAERLDLLELLRTSRSIFRHISETVRFSEIISRFKVSVRAISENVRLSEVVISIKGFVKVFSESLHLSEVFSVMRNIFRRVGELVVIGEFFERLRSIFRMVSEYVSLIEENVLSRYINRIANMVVSIVEVLSPTKSKVLLVIENIRVVEDIVKTGIIKIKAFIGRLGSSLKGRVGGGMKGKVKGGEI